MKQLIHIFTAILLLAFSIQGLSSSPDYEGDGNLFESGADMAAFLEEAPVDEIVKFMDYLGMPLESVEDIVENYEELMDVANQQMALEALEEHNETHGVNNTTCSPP